MGCPDRGPVSINGGAPTEGYSPRGGDIFDNFTGEDITADAAADAASNDMAATWSALLNGTFDWNQLFDVEVHATEFNHCDASPVNFSVLTKTGGSPVDEIYAQMEWAWGRYKL